MNIINYFKKKLFFTKKIKPSKWRMSKMPNHNKPIVFVWHTRDNGCMQSVVLFGKWVVGVHR